jgi:hypothetical protein
MDSPKGPWCDACQLPYQMVGVGLGLLVALADVNNLMVQNLSG